MQENIKCLVLGLRKDASKVRDMVKAETELKYLPQ
jgi:hypothetical protein